MRNNDIASKIVKIEMICLFFDNDRKIRISKIVHALIVESLNENVFEKMFKNDKYFFINKKIWWNKKKKIRNDIFFDIKDNILMTILFKKKIKNINWNWLIWKKTSKSHIFFKQFLLKITSFEKKLNICSRPNQFRKNNTVFYFDLKIVCLWIHEKNAFDNKLNNFNVCDCNTIDKLFCFCMNVNFIFIFNVNFVKKSCIYSNHLICKYLKNFENQSCIETFYFNVLKREFINVNKNEMLFINFKHVDINMSINQLMHNVFDFVLHAIKNALQIKYDSVSWCFFLNRIFFAISCGPQAVSKI